nr:MerR family transcriptional regulator [uncultured Anaeromusa sp.]
MGYTIKQVATRFAISTHTLRYYEKEGILPLVGRDENGNRQFSEADLEWLVLIRCLRDTGMSVGEIKAYVALCQQGDATIFQRREIIAQHKRDVEGKITRMQEYLTRIDRKLQGYDAFIAGESSCVCQPARSLAGD